MREGGRQEEKKLGWKGRKESEEGRKGGGKKGEKSPLTYVYVISRHLK